MNRNKKHTTTTSDRIKKLERRLKEQTETKIEIVHAEGDWKRVPVKGKRIISDWRDG